MNQANKEKIKTGVWSAVGGAVIAMIIGFDCRRPSNDHVI